MSTQCNAMSQDLGNNDTLSFLAHDIRNIAATAVLDIETLLDSKNTFNQRVGRRLQQQLNRMVDLCASVSAPAKLRSDLIEPYAENGVVSVLDVIQEMIASLPCSKQDLMLTVACAENAETDLCPIRLFRILYNLTSNAIDALKANPEGEISIACLIFADTVRIDIRDNGDGLPDSVKNLFEDRSTTYRAIPSLGVAVAKNLAKELNGTLSLVKSDKEGTHYRLEFSVPYREDAPCAQPQLYQYQLNSPLTA